MARNPERNDRKSGKSAPFSGKAPRGGDGPKKAGPGSGSGGGDRGGWNPNPREKTFAESQRAPRPQRAGPDADNFLWGRHPVVAALANPARKGMGRLLATADRAAEIEREGLALHGHKVEVMDAQLLDRMLPAGAVHQGMVFKVAALEGVSLDDIADPAEGIIVMLDQLTDPQNVGAIFRSALAFGAKGIVVQDRHSPALAGALAKASAGAPWGWTDRPMRRWRRRSTVGRRCWSWAPRATASDGWSPNIATCWPEFPCPAGSRA